MAHTAIRPARILSILTGVALTAGVMSVVAAPAHPAHAAAGHQAATPDQRTRHSVTHKNTNGSFTTTLSAEPMNYRDGKGNWQPIDSRVVPAQRAGYAYRNAANDFTALFKAASDAGYLRVEVAGVPLDLSLTGAAAAAVRVNGRQVSYPQVLAGVDLRYDMTAGGLKETLVLADAGAPTHYQFLLTAPQHTPLAAKRLPNGAWAFVAPGHGGQLFELAPPRLDDAAAATGSQIRAGRRAPKSAVNLAVTRASGGFRLDLTVDQAWLQAPQRRFPVLLDPTIEVQPPAQTGDFTASCASCADTGSPLWIGTDSTDSWRAAVQFNLGDLPPGATVSSATLGVWNDATNCIPTSSNICGASSHTINVHRMTSAWDTVNTTSSQLAWDAIALSSYTLAANAPSAWMSWNVQATVQNWANGAQPNFGFLLKRSTEPLDAGGPAAPGADAADPTQAPKLDITYTSDAVKLYQPETLHSDGADLRWSAYGYPDGHPFQGYQIHRSTTANFTPSAATLIATIGDPNVTSFRDTTAAASTAFTYKVTVNGWSSYGQTATLPADGTATKTLQLGPESNGTYLESVTGDPNCANNGTDDDLWIGDDTDGAKPATNWLYRPLLQFDLGDIPASATVTNATLSLHTDLMPPAKTVTVDVHRVTSSWQEGTGYGTCTGDGASWNETQGGVKWKSPGGDYDPTVIASTTHYATDGTGWDSFNVASAVQQWASGQAPNFGLLLRFADETPVPVNWFGYASDDYSYDPTWRPKLSITYRDGSHPHGPAEAIASPAAGAVVSGSAQSVTATASDDSSVAKVDFLVDGVVKATDSTAPYAMTWNTTTATNATHTLTARATDNAGNVTTSSATSVTVDNTALPTTSVTAPAAGAAVSGSTVSFAASASGGQPISKVEFYVDGTRLADDTTSPYSVTWNTLDQTVASYDGSHTLTTMAYDSLGRVATSSGVTVTTANTAASKFKAGFSTTAVPQAVTYDPTAPTQQTEGVDVTVSNTSTLSWSASDVVLRYRWYSPDATPVVTDGTDVPLAADLPAGQSATLRVLVPAPVLPDGVTKAQYKLRLDLYSKTSAAWFADKGNPPNENPVVVNRLLSDDLGLERWFHYEGEDIGAGMQHIVNVSNGNSLLSWSPWQEPGRGLATTLDLTYNSLEKKSESPIGNNFSLSISSLTRWGNPIDIHPNNADSIAGRSNKYVELIDGDGTTHRFTGQQAADGSTYWTEPAGVHLYLRRYSTTDATKAWALSRPDRVTFFYNDQGYPTSVQDANGNTITFQEDAIAPGDDPGGPKWHISKVTDAAGRSWTITYYTKATAKKPQIRGKISQITEHNGDALRFDYYEDGNLLRITQAGGRNADGSLLPDRSFVFTYTTSNGDAAAIPLATDRVNPDPKTPNESTRLYSVRDPRGNETTFAYLGSGYGQDRWKLASRTDRDSTRTTWSYDTTNRITTQTAPLSRVSKFGYDTAGKPTSLTNPNNETTTFSWTADNAVSQVTEPSTHTRKYEYNDNGYLTATTDEANHRTELAYQNVAVDAADVSGKWASGRTVPHYSQLATLTNPRGVATPEATTPTDYEWLFSYDANGNLLTTADPEDRATNGKVTTYAYNPDGTVHTATDPNGHVTTYESYDANGLPISVLDAKGQRMQASYDAAGQLQWVQDGNHPSSTYSGGTPQNYRSYLYYDSFHRQGATSEPKSSASRPGVLIWSGTSFDANDNLLSEESPHEGTASGDPGTSTVWTHSYDAMDRVLQDTNPDKSVDPAGERTQYRYDDAGRLVQLTSPRGVVTSSSTQDFATYYDYDVLDRVRTTTRYTVDSTGAVTNTLRTFYCYDVAGDLRSVTSPNAHVSSVTCAPYANASNTTKYDYFADHRLQQATDPDGHITSQTYDENGNVASYTDPLRGRPVLYSYNQRDQLIKQVQPFDDSVTPHRDVTTQYSYDPAGNVQTSTSPRGSDAGNGDYVTSYGYDQINQPTLTTLPKDASTPQLYIHQAFDANGNQTMVSQPVRSNDPTTLTSDQKTTMQYYDTGWLLSRDKPGSVPKSNYDYTPEGWQSSRTATGTDGTSRNSSWAYFSDGMLKSMTGEDKQVTSYTYDEDNNLKTAQLVSGSQDASKTINLTVNYDGLDRLTSSNTSRSTTSNVQVSSLSYDDDNNVTQAIQNAVQGPNPDAGHTIDYFYTPGHRIDHIYDHGKNSASTALADDRRVTYHFLDNGLPQNRTVEADGNSFTTKQTTDWTWFLNGQLKTLVTKNGAGAVRESHAPTYIDAAGNYVNGNPVHDTFQLTSPDSGKPCQTSDCTVDYTYDALDRLTQEKRQRGTTQTTDYTLNDSGDITKLSVNGAVQRTYSYTGDQLNLESDAAGNPLGRYLYDAYGNLNCITTGTTDRSVCDTWNNPTRSSQLEMHTNYDALDRMLSSQTYTTTGQLDRSASYTYDPLNRPITEVQTDRGGSTGTDGTLPQSTTTFSYLGLSNDVTNELRTSSVSTDPQETRDYTYGAMGERLGLTFQRGQNTPKQFYYGHDTQGSVSQLLDDSGNAQASYGYQAYGSADPAVTDEHDPETGQVTDSGNALPPANPLNSYRWQDKRVDRGSGSLDMGARRYSAGTAHFMQADKYEGALNDLSLEEDTLTQNRYGFAGGNPVSYIDQDGHMPIDFGSVISSIGRLVKTAVRRVATAVSRASSSSASSSGSYSSSGTTSRATTTNRTDTQSASQSSVFSNLFKNLGSCVGVSCLPLSKNVKNECLDNKADCAASAGIAGVEQLKKEANKLSDQKIAENASLRRSGNPAKRAAAVFGRAPEAARRWRTVAKIAGKVGKLGDLAPFATTALAIHEGENPGRAIAKGVGSEVGGRLGASAGAALCSEAGPVAIACAAGGAAVGSAAGSLAGGAAYDAGSWAVDKAGELADTVSSGLNNLGDTLGL